MFLNFDKKPKYREIFLPDLSRTTPYTSHEVQARIRHYIENQPSTTKYEFVVSSVEGNSNLQAFALRKRVVYFGYEEPIVIIQGYLRQEDGNYKTKIMATANIAASYWISSSFVISLLLVIGSIALYKAPSALLLEAILIIFLSVLCVQILLIPFMNRNKYIVTFVNEIKHILPKEDGMFE